MLCSTDDTTEKSENYLWSVNFCVGRVSFHHKNFTLRILFSDFSIKVGALLQPINLLSLRAKTQLKKSVTLITTLLQPHHSSLRIALHLHSPNALIFTQQNTYHVSFNKHSVRYSLHFISSSCFSNKKIEGTRVLNPLIPKSAIWHIMPQLCQYLTDFYEFFTPRWSCEDLLIKRIKT